MIDNGNTPLRILYSMREKALRASGCWLSSRTHLHSQWCSKRPLWHLVVLDPGVGVTDIEDRTLKYVDLRAEPVVESDR